MERGRVRPDRPDVLTAPLPAPNEDATTIARQSGYPTSKTERTGDREVKKSRRTTAVLGAIAAMTGAGLAAGVPASSGSQPGGVEVRAASERTVTSAQAGLIGKRAIQSRTGRNARAITVRRSASYGAMWDVEVRASGGQKFDVFVASTGRVTQIVKKVTTSQSY